MVKSSQTIIWAQVDVLGSESHSIHCPTKTVVWDCDIGNDHPDVPAKHLDFWTWDVANLRTTTPIYSFGFDGHGGGLSREPCSTVFQGHQICQVCNVFRVYIAPGDLPRIDIRVWLHVLGLIPNGSLQWSSSLLVRASARERPLAWLDMCVCVIACASAIERY